MRFCFIIALTAVFYLPLPAQPSDCGQKIVQASRLYEEGRFEEVGQLLDGCLKAEGLSANERARVAFYLHRVYNAQGKFAEADSIRQYAIREGIAEYKPGDRKEIEGGLMSGMMAFLLDNSGSEAVAQARSSLPLRPEEVVGNLEVLIDTVRLRPALKVEALELLTEAYLQLGLPEKADDAFRKIYPLRPQYEAGGGRSLNYRQFASRYASEPRYSFGLGAGLHTMKPYHTDVFSPSGVQIKQEKYQTRYNPHVALQFSHMPVSVRKMIKWEYLFTLGYVEDSYEYEGQYGNVSGPIGGPQEAAVTFKERQRKWSLGGMLQFYLPNPFRKRTAAAGPGSYQLRPGEGEPLFIQVLRRMEPYLALGLGGQRLNYARMEEPAILYEEGSALVEEDIRLAYRENFFHGLQSDAGPAQRTEYTYSLLGRLGLKYRSNRWFYFIEGGYAWTPVNMVAADARAANSTLVEDFSYLDNDLRQHHLGISAGIGYSLYYTVKIR